MNAATPFQIRGIDHVVLRVADLDGMIAFYRKVLGCTLERGPGDARLAQLRAGASLIDLVQVGGPLAASAQGPEPKVANMDHFCVVIEPWDPGRMLAHLQEHGVNAGEIATRYGARGRAPSLYIEDPERNTVELRAGRAADAATD